MRKSTMIVVAIGLAMALSLPILGMTLAAPKATMTAQITDREGLHIKLLPPLLGKTEWYGGAVIPVRVLVTEPDESNLVGASVTLWVNHMPAASPGNVNMGNNFTEMGKGIFQFNLNTKPYPAGPGSEPITLDIITQASDDRTTGLELLIHLN